MKYPQDQFEALLKVLKQVSVIYDIKESNPLTLHYICYQQACNEGQEHNKLYVYGTQMKRYGNLTEEEKQVFVSFIQNVEFDFKLYPDNCNDSHINTAMKKAIKLLNL